MSYVLGIDFGTSGCRAVVLDADKQLIADAQSPLPESKHCQQSPQDWWQGLDNLMQQLRAQLDLTHICKLLLDGTSSTVLLADEHGEPLTPALMYNDSSSTLAAKTISGYADANSPAQGVSSSLAKALHLLETTDKAAYVLHQADWLSNTLCGQFGYSDYNNALKLGYDPQTETWEPWLSKLIALDLLPEVHAPGSALGAISPKWAQTWGLNPTLQILAGTTDSTASFLATGASQNGDAVTALGSSLVLKILSPVPIFAPELGVYSHKLGGQWLVGGASNSGGAVLKSFFSTADLQQLSEHIDISLPCPWDYYPLLQAGERFPINDPEYPPCLSPRPEADSDFLYGLLMGMTRIEAQGYQVLQRLGAPAPKRLYSTGGGTNNPVWQQLRERMLGLKLQSVKQQQAAYGAALLALH